MPEKIADRIVWAVETLAVTPDDRVLEIGCGHGVSVSLVCAKLDGGKITAIDRSEAMIGKAKKRNRAHIAAGKAAFQTAALTEADFGGEQFNKIFAVNVSLFLKESANELAIVRDALTPDGVVYLFYQPPEANKTQELAAALAKTLRSNGFSIDVVLFKAIKPAPGVCVIARRG